MDLEPYEPRRVHWFGRPWPRENLRAPVCDDDRYWIPVPTGVRCCHCDEPIDGGDRGVRYSGSVTVDPEGKPIAGPIPYAHAECQLMAVVGNLEHLHGNCRHVGECIDLLSDVSSREQARGVWRELVG